jgi:hypothetical protein
VRLLFCPKWSAEPERRLNEKFKVNPGVRKQRRLAGVYDKVELGAVQ